MRRSLAAVVAVLVTIGGSEPRSAGALVLSEDELEETSTEVGVVGRSFAFILFGDTLEPPLMFEDMSPMGLGIFDLRLYFAQRSPRWKLVIHNQLTSTMRSHGLAGDLAFGRGAPPLRWLPLRWNISDEETLSLRNTVDWLYAAYSGDSFTITAGRQPVTFGRGKLWSPSDLVGTFSLTEVDTEYKPGADGVRLDWSPNDRTNVTVVAAAAELEADDDFEASLNGSAVLAHAKRGFNHGEVGLLGGYVRRDVVAGVDGVYDTGSFEIYGEATITYVADRSASAIQSPIADEGDVVPKAIIGATFRPTRKLMVSPEILYNGFGASDAEEYDDVAVSGRVGVGEQTTLGKLYLGGVADWELHPLVHITGMSLVNLYDPSGLLSVGVNYSLSDNVEAQLGGYIPIGESPEVTILPPSLVARDEYGLYPYFVYFEMKAIL